MNTIHPTATVGADVQLGTGNVIGPYAVILGPAWLGDDNWVGPHAVIGTPGEIRGIDHGDGMGFEPMRPGVGTGVRIGSRNVLREHITIHQGHYARTVVGDDCYLMNRVYLAHDDVVEDGVTMASAVTLGGHVQVGRAANLGMGAVVHQRRLVGPGAMVGMGAVVTRDVPPYGLAYGNPARVRGANRLGLERAGLDADVVAVLDAAYAAGQVPDDAPGLGTEDVWAWWRTRNVAASEG